MFGTKIANVLIYSGSKPKSTGLLGHILEADTFSKNIYYTMITHTYDKQYDNQHERSNNMEIKQNQK